MMPRFCIRIALTIMDIAVSFHTNDILLSTSCQYLLITTCITKKHSDLDDSMDSVL